ncbi:MAG: LD-carboxypeptidase, partial [bacterium]|nr:LD-carboxypeptidase [bacterium]
MKIINAQKLKKGDLISILSPSAGLGELFPHRIENGIKYLEKIGFKVEVEKNALKRKNWVSGSIKERVDDIHSAFKNKKVKAIICTIGGNHSNQLLKYLDFKLIRNNPKIFLGYSDITVLHNAIYKKAGLRTFYGPCIISEFGEYPEMLPFTKNYFDKTLIEGAVGNIKPSKEWTDEFLNWFDTKF